MPKEARRDGGMQVMSALKVIIGLKPNGHALYPDFNRDEFQSVLEGLDWSIYVDKYGCSWHYDKCCGHREDDPSINSPRGVQHGVLIVPEDFCNIACSVFPETCSKLTEAELEDFYDNRAHAHESEEVINDKVLGAINAKRGAGVELSQADLEAIDPTNEREGIKANPKRRWNTAKGVLKVKIV